MKKILLFLLLINFIFSIHSQVGKTQTLMINATAATDGITLNWKAETFSGDYRVFKRTNLQLYNWGTQLAVLPSTATSYKDVSATAGKAIEYLIVKTNGTNALAYGYIYAGNNLKETHYKGGIVLVVDSTFIGVLDNEINRYENDLKVEGWQVTKIYAGRNEKPTTVKTRLKNHVNNRTKPTTTVFLIGHIPVPYSGGFTGDGSNWPPPDGHVEGVGNHTGAWPADAYYGDLNFDWADTDITMTTGAETRNHNIPGDGKFDPTKLADTVELEVGRLDLFNMTSFPQNEITLTKNYFNRNHLWRTQQYTAIERGLIDDNFTGFSISAVSWHNFSAFFPIDSVINTKDYFTEMSKNSYLWSFGSGAGSYTSCNGIGTTNSFVTDSLKNVFTMLAGSFFGDWDVQNSFLKAPLCKNALASFWGGIPKWYVHTMAMGKHIGFGTKESQNNNTFYYSGNFNGSANEIHIALMGDPTLCNRHLPPTKGLTAISNNKIVKLNWQKANGNFDGYAIYKLDTLNNAYTRVNNQIITDTFYNDSNNFYTGNYTYVVKTIRKETTASGTYFNVGGESRANVSHTNSISKITNPQILVYPNPTKDFIQIKDENYTFAALIDMQGREMIVNVNNNILDLTSLPSGIYILRLTNKQNQETTLPIIKQ